MSADPLAGLFDYAGLFPPAELPWDDMLREAASHATALRRPELVAADLVVTPDHLALLSPEALSVAGFPPGRTITACMVGVAAADGPEMAARLAAFNEEGPVRFVSLELATPEPTRDQGAVAGSRLGLQVYLEPRWDDAAWQTRAEEAFRVLDALAEGGPAVGLKVRCAGPTALSAQGLAGILPEVASRDLPFKATQGLHHPVAGDPVHGNVHGFLNVLLALRLAEHVDEATLAAILADTDASHFRLDDGLAWKEMRVDAADLSAAAARVPFAIGSCSLHDPDDGLARLG